MSCSIGSSPGTAALERGQERILKIVDETGFENSNKFANFTMYNSKTEHEILEEFTKKRLKELQEQISLKEITDEKLLLKKTQTDTLIVHFYNPNYKRCKEMNSALEEMVVKFPSIQFLCAEATSFSFLADRLEIKQLPYLATFTGGYFTGGIIGFQDIGEDVLDKSLLEKFIRQFSTLEKKADEIHQ